MNQNEPMASVPYAAAASAGGDRAASFSRRYMLVILAALFLAGAFYQLVVRQIFAGLPSVPGGAMWLFILFAVCHACYTLGWRHTLILFGASAVISWGYEQLGVATGLIYGPYHYSDMLGAKLGHVPVLIPLGWFMMIYPSYIIANLIADGRPTGTRGGVGRVLWLAALSVAVPIIAWVSMFRIAKPGSPWAYYRYRNKPQKLAKAQARAEKWQRRQEPVQNWIQSNLFGLSRDSAGPE